MLYRHITELIGNTPLFEIDPAVHGIRNVDLYAKLEYFNPFGSVKDRIAWGMIKDDVEKIQREGRTMIEASSGNTAKALQVLASVYGIPFKAFTNRTKVTEVKDVLQLLGTEIQEFPYISECLDPTVPDNVFESIRELLEKEPDLYYHSSQYTNKKNIDTHYKTTAQEIFQDIGPVDFLIGGLGTSGSTRGTAMRLKEINPHLKTIGVVSSQNDFIPGIRSEKEMWEVGLFEKEFYDKIVTIDSNDAIDATMELVKKLGILAGPSSGAAYAASKICLKKIDSKKRTKAVFIACDRIEWYSSYFRKRRYDLFGKQHSIQGSAILTKEDLRKALELTSDDAENWIKEKNALVIDIRSYAAYKAGHILRSINIPQEQLEELMNHGVPFSPKTTILFVCPIGEQSKHFSALLEKRGYDAANLSGGITAWRDAGKKLITMP